MGVFISQLPATKLVHLKAELAETLVANFCYPRFFDYRANSLRMRPVDREQRQEVWLFLSSIDFTDWDDVDLLSPGFRSQLEDLFIRFVQQNGNFFGQQGRKRIADVRLLIDTSAAQVAKGLREYLLEGQEKASLFGSARSLPTWSMAPQVGRSEPSWEQIGATTMQLQLQMQEVRGEIEAAAALRTVQERQAENGLATARQERQAENGLATAGLERLAENGLTSTGRERQAENGLASTGQERQAENGLASTGLERLAENGLASTGQERQAENGLATAGQERQAENGLASIEQERLAENGLDATELELAITDHLPIVKPTSTRVTPPAPSPTVGVVPPDFTVDAELTVHLPIPTVIPPPVHKAETVVPPIKAPTFTRARLVGAAAPPEQEQLQQAQPAQGFPPSSIPLTPIAEVAPVQLKGGIPLVTEDIAIFEQMRHQLVLWLRMETVRLGMDVAGLAPLQLLDVLRRREGFDETRLQVASTLLNLSNQVIKNGQASLFDYKQALMLYLIHAR